METDSNMSPRIKSDQIFQRFLNIKFFVGKQNPRLTPDPLPPSYTVWRNKLLMLHTFSSPSSKSPTTSSTSCRSSELSICLFPFCLVHMLWTCHVLDHLCLWIKSCSTIHTAQLNLRMVFGLLVWNFKCKELMNRTDWTVNYSKTLSAMNWPSEGSLPTFSSINL